MANRFIRSDRNYNLTDEVTMVDEQIEGVEFLLTRLMA